jgi:hypothetical protein
MPSSLAMTLAESSGFFSMRVVARDADRQVEVRQRLTMLPEREELRCSVAGIL